MKNKQKLILKILAGVVAVIIIGGVLFITNAFVGNPISAMMANKAISQYVDKNYSYLDIETEKAIYNFKDGSYMARAKSKTSIDTKFAIYYSDGKVQRDDYQRYVLGMYNTLDRLSGEYSTIAKNIIAKELGYEKNSTRVMYYKDEYEKPNDALELDMKFNKALPIKAEVAIYLDLTNNSLEGISKVLTDVHKSFVVNGCIISKYSLTSDNDGSLVEISGVTPANIESGELLILLKKAEMDEDTTIIEKGDDKKPIEGITIFRKGEKK